MENEKSLVVNKNEKAGLENHKTASLNSSFGKEINQAWDLYREQLQRNFELMRVISEQQRIIEKFVSENTALPEGSQKNAALEVQQAIPIIQNNEEEIKYIPYDRIQKLHDAYCTVYQSGLSRNDALANHLNMIYILYQLKEATPEKWFMQICVPQSTAYRYATYMRKNHIIKSVRGKYMLTSIGLMLMEEKADTPAEQADLCKKLKKEREEFTMRQHTRQETLPESNEFFNKNYRGM